MRKYSKALTNLAIALVVLLGSILLLPRVLVFFMPFVAGWILALIAGPMVRFFEEKVKLKRKIGSAFVIIAVIAAVVLLLYSIFAYLFDQMRGLIGALPAMWEGISADFDEAAGRLEAVMEKLPFQTPLNLGDITEALGHYVGDFVGRLSTPTIEAAGNFAKLLPGFFIGLIMALLSAYFFVAERMQINEWFRKHMPAVVQMYYRMIRNSLARSVGGYVIAQLKIEVWMYLLLLIGLGVLQINYFALIAFIIAFLDFIPFLGTGTVLVPWAIFRILAGDYGVAIGLLIIWGVGQLARQLIQPKIVGDSIGVPPIPTLFLLYIGYKVGGVIGMIVAVPIGLLLYTMYREGAFDTTKNSVLLIIAGINRFRRIDREEMAEVEEMAAGNREAFEALERQRREEELKRQTDREAKKKNRKKAADKNQ